MQIETVELADLVMDKKNARKHNDRNIKEVQRSLDEFGQHAPLVVQRKTNRILVGNGRYEAMLRLGWTEASVLFVDDDDETAVRRALADNRTAELAEWDDKVLHDLVSEIGATEIPGWSDDELGEILNISMGIFDIDDLLNEESPKTAVKDPIWLVARTSAKNQDVIYQATELLRDHGIEVDLSHVGQN